MSNAYQTAVSLGLTTAIVPESDPPRGYTPAEIVLQLQATGVTHQPISLAYLMEMLNLRGMLRKTDGSGGQERWVGTLQNLKAALVAMGLTEQVTAYEMWFSHVTNPRQTHWDTTQSQYAAGFWAMYRNFADLENMPSSADFAAVAALGGGWQFWTLAVDEFAAQRQTAEADQLRFEMRSRLDAILNQIGTSEQADGIADLRAIADELEAV
jgi:hypothetical protein